jgi:general transcription factor 3C polypeptide 5 (transcription factor C subunit 1)
MTFTLISCIEYLFKIQKAFSRELGALELKFRPNDPLSHCITGEIVESSNLLLKVTRKRRKIPKGDGNDEKSTAEVIGVVSKTARFRGFEEINF